MSLISPFPQDTDDAPPSKNDLTVDKFFPREISSELTAQLAIQSEIQNDTPPLSKQKSTSPLFSAPPWEQASLNESPVISAFSNNESFVSWGFVVMIIVIMILVLVSLSVVIVWLVTPPDNLSKQQGDFAILQQSQQKQEIATTLPSMRPPPSLKKKGLIVSKDKVEGETTRRSMLDHVWWDSKSKTTAVQARLETEQPIRSIQFFVKAAKSKENEEEELWKSQLFQPPIGLITEGDWQPFGVQRFYLPIRKTFDIPVVLVMHMIVDDKIQNSVILESEIELPPSLLDG